VTRIVITVEGTSAKDVADQLQQLAGQWAEQAAPKSEPKPVPKAQTKPEPKPEPEPQEQEQEQEVDGPALTEVRAMMAALLQDGKRDEAKRILTEVGKADKLSDVAPERLADVLAAAKEAGGAPA